MISSERFTCRMLCLVAAVLVCFSGTTASGADPTSHPNIVLILADDLSHGDLSCCGGSDVRTPHIDRIFREGRTLTRFRTNSSVCSPSRAALLTGRYPDCVGVPGVIRTHPDQNFGRLAPDAVLLPTLLKPAGYATALIGKWHLGLAPPDTPNARGFEIFRGFLGDMMDSYETHRRHGINYLRNNSEAIDPQGHATDLFTQWAIDFLKERRSDARPFFLLLAYNAPHAPIQPPADWLKRVRDRAPDLPDMRSRRIALVEHMDDGVGRVLTALAEAQLDKNCFVIFTSDNGGPLDFGALNDKLRDGKGSMYEGGLRVPCGACWPGRIAPGSSSDAAAVTMDLFPTALEAAAIERPRNIDGVSILPTLLGQPQKLARPLFFMRREGGRGFWGEENAAVIDGDWKLVHNSPFRALELFNLADDPSESHDLAAREPKVRDRLARELQLHLQTAGMTPWQSPANRQEKN
ncbi:MAG TPA: sulfatase-like hydrolase/transferase [Planctomycetaceae bacterium]|jgi:arylsulfatase A-like enzyme|nr:sulfatase-like hydrolase/transferase [Planctomycetaceae bacterium]